VQAFRRIMDDDAVALGEVNETGWLSLPGVEPIHVSDLADAFNSRTHLDAVAFDELAGPPAEGIPTSGSTPAEGEES
jgi:hypothetical protein